MDLDTHPTPHCPSKSETSQFCSKDGWLASEFQQKMRLVRRETASGTSARAVLEPSQWRHLLTNALGSHAIESRALLALLSICRRPQIIHITWGIGYPELIEPPCTRRYLGQKLGLRC